MLQYYGKWPFLRILGFQEPASSALAVVNIIPHAYQLIFRSAFYRLTPQPLRSFLRVYSIAAIHCWTWSMVFHARDVWWTERLDYHSSTLFLMYSLALAFVRIFRLRSTSAVAVVHLCVWALTAQHVFFLNFVRFDYGYNMRVSLVILVAHCGLWTLWATDMMCRSKNRKRRSYLWKCIAFCFFLPILGTLEVLDFAPLLGVFDGHALFHSATPLMACLWYSFLQDEIKYLSQFSDTAKLPGPHGGSTDKFE